MNRIATIAMVLLSASITQATANDVCKRGYYSAKFYPDDFERYSMAQVFLKGDMTADDYKGTAFVVDARLGLLLTAQHVIQHAGGGTRLIGEQVTLRFPRISRKGSVVKARIVKFVRPNPKHGTGEKVDSHNIVRDLALLKLEDSEILGKLRSVRLSFTDNPTVRATIYSFLEAADDAEVTEGTLSEDKLQTDIRKYAACALRLDEPAGSGESGGPVVDEFGHVVGITLSFRKKGGKFFGEVLPLHCARDLLSAWMQEEHGESVSTLSRWFMSSDRDTMADLLRGSESGDQISNISFQSALNHFVDVEVTKITGIESSREQMLDKYWCPLVHAIEGRRILLSTDRRRKLMAHLHETESTGQIADALFQEARELQERNDKSSAREAAIVAAEFHEYERQRLSNVAASTDSASDNNSWQIAVAQSLKGQADALLLAGLMSDKEDEERETLLTQSAEASLRAATVAGDIAPSVGAQAVATWAVAQHNLERNENAAVGFAVAYNNGARARWIREGYKFTSGLSSGYVNAEKAPGYQKIDAVLPASALRSNEFAAGAIATEARSRFQQLMRSGSMTENW